MNKSQQDVKKIFGNLQKVERVLAATVSGYKPKAIKHKDFESYFQSQYEHIGATEIARISDSIKMFKSIKAFESKFDVSPKLDLASSVKWQDQISGQTHAHERGVKIQLVKDYETGGGQIVIENTKTGVHAVAEFSFPYNKETGLGHIQLKNDGKEMFPLLESALRHQVVIDSAHPNAVGSPAPTFGKIDSNWLNASVSLQKNASEVFSEVAASTGTGVVRSVERTSESISLGM